MVAFSGYICDECGTQSQHPNRWLMLSSLEVRKLLSGAEVSAVASELDFCSPGCLVRWVSKTVEKGDRLTCHVGLESVEPIPEPIAVKHA
jgi:hypothetical protein